MAKYTKTATRQPISRLSTQERAVLTTLLKKRVGTNTTKIANSSNVSWNTAQKYLDRMYSRGWLTKKGNSWKVKRK